MSTPVRHFYEFGSFRLDFEQRILWHKDQHVRLAPKLFDTLLLLIERRERIVGKEEMMRVLWPDSYVEEANLTQNIFMLRRLLAEGGPDHGPYIETVKKRGYRFNLPVKEIQIEGGISVTPEESEDRDTTVTEPEIPSRQPNATTTIAVLPIVNETMDPTVEYLSDGITESIINSLSQLPQVRVVARSLVFHYRGEQFDALKTGRELTADVVLLGRVVVLGNKLIIRVELVEVSSGFQIWGEQYHTTLSDILTVQDEVATKISAKLRIKLTAEEKRRLGQHYTDNPEAYENYLKGRYYWNKRTGAGYEKAIEHFEQAIKLDPGYALAYSGLADSYVAFDFFGVLPPWETGPKAKKAAIAALLLNDSLAEAHTSLACVEMMYERDWSNAEKEFKRAIELDPNYAQAHNWYSHFLMAMGRIEESLAENERALKLDPLDDSINQYLGWHYQHARQFDRAIGQLEKTLAENPEFFLARVTLGMAYEQNGEIDKAIAEFQKAYELEKNNVVLGFLGHAYAMSGNREAAQKILKELEELSRRVYVPAYNIALIYTALGETDHAFEWFEKAYAARNEWLNWFKTAPEVDSLRAYRRFTELLGRLNLVPDE
ncbi:MAG TPA: tetratricopeptide repeat protein [Pyrinomonadaceae bacterium]|nr:tetratricopeptide repeat protein [Pyrinomonadaceae bacterium]